MKIYFLFFFLFASITAFTQIDFEVEYQKQYDENVKKEFINDVYIPKDFDEAFLELRRLASEDALIKFKMAEEDVIAHKLHFGIGRWISVNWNFDGGSRFSHLMKEMGVSFPDDMIQMTIVSFHRHLNGQPLELKHQAKVYFEKRKKENEDRKEHAIELVNKNN